MSRKLEELRSPNSKPLVEVEQAMPITGLRVNL
jgi:hypothetical protein